MNFKRYLEYLEKTQWFSRRRLEEIQKEKMKNLIENVYKNVPYYHNLLRRNDIRPSDINSLEDLKKLPILKREDVITNLKDLISREEAMRNLIEDFTSGVTTGRRVTIYRERENQEMAFAAEMRAYRWYNIDLKERFCYIIGGYDIINEREIMDKLIHKLIDFFSFKISIDPLEMIDIKKLDLFVKKMINSKRRVLYGDPSAMCRLIDYLEGKDILPSIEIAISTGDPLIKYQRKRIENFFGCEVYDIYGTSEILGIAFECPTHEGYHLTSENVIMEIVDENGENVASGEKGFILLTDLNNCAMPFIRYKIGDIGRLSDKTCSCGRDLHLILPIDGQLVLRENHFVYSHDMKKMYLPEFSFLLEDFSKIKNFQIIQNRDKSIILKVEVGKKFSSIVRDEIIARLKHLLGDISIDFEIVDNIEFDKYSNAYKFIVNKLLENSCMA